MEVSCDGFLMDDLAPSTTGVDVLEGSNLPGSLNSWVVTEKSPPVSLRVGSVLAYGATDSVHTKFMYR